MDCKCRSRETQADRVILSTVPYKLDVYCRRFQYNVCTYMYILCFHYPLSVYVKIMLSFICYELAEAYLNRYICPKSKHFSILLIDMILSKFAIISVIPVVFFVCFVTCTKKNEVTFK